MRLALLRRALAPAVAAAVAAAITSAAVAPVAGAQVIAATYAPSCGPNTACSLARFLVYNTTPVPLLINSLTLTAPGATFRFAPAAGGVALYQAVDAVSPFGGGGTVAAGGTSIFLDFLGGNGFAFELAPAGGPTFGGYIEVPLTTTAALTGAPFTYSGTTAAGASFTGTIAAVPEPATVALVGGGLALVGIAARRRRQV